MNDHVPDSSGLPLRAMVMVLLFLGVIFLLLGFQWLTSSDSSDDDAASTTTSSVTTTTTTSEAALPDVDVRVYNISDQEGLAGATADQLREAHYNVTDVTNLVLTDVSQTTVYFTADDAAEKRVAESIGTLLNAPAEPRIDDPDVAEQPPGVIVVVAG